MKYIRSALRDCFKVCESNVLYIQLWTYEHRMDESQSMMMPWSDLRISDLLLSFEESCVIYTDTKPVKHAGRLTSPSAVLYYSLDVRPVSEAAAGLVCKQHGVGPTCFCTLLTGPVRLIGAEVRRQAAKSRLFPSLTATNKGHYIKCVSKLWLEG